MPARARGRIGFAFSLAAVLGLLPATCAVAAGGGPGVFTDTAALPGGRTGHTATLLGDGRVLLVGGEDGLGHVLASAIVFDPRSNTWRSASGMTVARDSHTATLLDDGRVLVAGGFLGGDSLESTASSEIYDPVADRWKVASPMLFPRARHSATLLRDGRVLVVGGISPMSAGAQLTDVAEVYDPRLDRWTALPGPAPAREGQSAVLLDSGAVFVVGGQGNGAEPEAGAALYDPRSSTWRALRTGTPRFSQTATLLARDSVLVLGGFGPEVLPPGPDLLSTGELHQPNEGTWSAVAEMPDVRAGHTATLLETGRVLVVGGAYLFDQAILYDPVTDRWTATGPPQRRYGHTATRLRDGRVLIAGGYGALTSAIIYDPAKGLPIDPEAPWLLAVIPPFALTLTIVVVLFRRIKPRLAAALREARDPDRWIE